MALQGRDAACYPAAMPTTVGETTYGGSDYVWAADQCLHQHVPGRLKATHRTACNEPTAELGFTFDFLVGNGAAGAGAAVSCAAAAGATPSSFVAEHMEFFLGVLMGILLAITLTSIVDHSRSKKARLPTNDHAYDQALNAAAQAAGSKGAVA